MLFVGEGQTVSSKQLYIVVVVIIVFTFIATFPVYQIFSFYGPSNATELSRNATETLFQIERFREEGVVFTYNPTKNLSIRLQCCILGVLFSIGYGFAFSVYYKIIKVVTEHANQNPHSSLVQIDRQINTVILLQLIVPMLVNGIPVVATAAMMFVGFSFPQMGVFNNLVSKWLSSLKPLLTIYFVPSYHHGFVHLCKHQQITPDNSRGSQTLYSIA
ncbi:unnamed protein product [Bursaphelenchus okinawaensis]|uniref:Uncharacterized protein n=1 Tax=Bursaphelenchus okinawaensis TaxID=465554 RepID=A0A811JRN1_9BILA|nr:unnamed protein product [Bursaphelenchus okinawaensis]CAG9080088.1 unnamed protein product [Bursaphelenchus okinawaensis]